MSRTCPECSASEPSGDFIAYSQNKELLCSSCGFSGETALFEGGAVQKEQKDPATPLLNSSTLRSFGISGDSGDEFEHVPSDATGDVTGVQVAADIAIRRRSVFAFGSEDIARMHAVLGQKEEDETAQSVAVHALAVIALVDARNFLSLPSHPDLLPDRQRRKLRECVSLCARRLPQLCRSAQHRAAAFAFALLEHKAAEQDSAVVELGEQVLAHVTDFDEETQRAEPKDDFTNVLEDTPRHVQCIQRVLHGMSPVPMRDLDDESASSFQTEVPPLPTVSPRNSESAESDAVDMNVSTLDVAVLESERDHMEQQLRQLHAENNALREMLESAIAELENRHGHTTREIDTQTSQDDEAKRRAEWQLLQRQLERLQQQKQEAETQVATLTAQLTEVTAEAETAKTTAETLQQVRSELAETQERAQHALDQARKAFLQQRDEAAAVQKEATKLRAERETLEKRVETAEASAEEARQVNAVLKEQVLDVRELQQQLRQRDDDLAALRSQIAELKSSADDSSELKALREKQAQSEQLMAEMLQALQRSDAELAQLRQQNERLTLLIDG